MCEYMKIVCYGDSNTYGWDPRFFSSNRYEHPWPELLAESTGYEVINCGEPGREVPYREEQLQWFGRDVKKHEPDLLLIMLGTNDLFYSLKATAEAVSERMDSMIQYAVREKLSGEILLLSCPAVRIPNEPYMDVLEEMAERYRKIAEQRGIGFADPFRWDIPLAYDGVHFTEDGHQVLEKKLFEILK